MHNQPEGDYTLTTKKGVVSLSLIVILTLCVLNVTATPMSKPTTAAHDAYITDARALQTTKIIIIAPAHAKVNESFELDGILTSGNIGIGNTYIHFQELQNGTWSAYANGWTNDGGGFVVAITPSIKGDVHLRATFDGTSQYAPCVSNEVTVTVS